MEFLAWLESTGFGTWVRESPSVFAYPSILFLHTVGLSLLVGTNVAIDLRLLGRSRDLPLAPMESFFKVMWLGFWINALSGVALLVADATTKLINPVFYVKMAFIACGVTTMVLIRKRVFHGVSRGNVLAVLSLVLWGGAITAGRLMAYFGPVSGLTQ
jgi:hypothetical protein